MREAWAVTVIEPEDIVLDEEEYDEAIAVAKRDVLGKDDGTLYWSQGENIKVQVFAHAHVMVAVVCVRNCRLQFTAQ